MLKDEIFHHLWIKMRELNLRIKMVKEIGILGIPGKYHNLTIKFNNNDSSMKKSVI
ncbi:unnamed protein product [Paramecium pentaurelia]|uniref:Uncharacterized protein n=1 Tax=Paramecium pentaurelia TaxID=43138 RepID=A0A8S1U661_9CILI|nr:unnamed protein product [Paramecium pentaurelia]